MIADISYEVPSIQLFDGIANAPGINERVYDILWEAVRELEQFEDALKSKLES